MVKGYAPHGQYSGLHGFLCCFASGPPADKLVPFLQLLVSGIFFNKDFATFISEHVSVMTVKLSSTKPEYYLLIPPG
jgi:hypothetical protein